MRHHTGTHLVLGAARRVLGQHVWQAGAQKGVESSRIDISHYERITDEQAREIERLATEVALQDIPVESEWLPREKAEQAYGYPVVPGRRGSRPRVADYQDWGLGRGGMRGNTLHKNGTDREHQDPSHRTNTRRRRADHIRCGNASPTGLSRTREETEGNITQSSRHQSKKSTNTCKHSSKRSQDSQKDWKRWEESGQSRRPSDWEHQRRQWERSN